MRSPFKHLDKLRHASRCPLGRQPDLSRLYPKWPRPGRRCRLLKPCAKQLIHRLLEWLTGAAYLLFEEACHIVVYCQSRSHILMLSLKHQDVKPLPGVVNRVGEGGIALRRD